MFVVEKGILWLLAVSSLKTITVHTTEVAKEGCIYAVDECPNNRIHFYLYTNFNARTPVEVSKFTDFKNVEFANTEYLKILIHGLYGSYSDEFNRSIRNAYFVEGHEYDIISVQYHWLKPTQECYKETVENVKVIGTCAAILLNNILKQRKFTSVHAIGFGVGAQIVGFMGKLLQTHYDITLDRATGLDPALSHFESIWNNLDTNSAAFVDIIHTNSGLSGHLMASGTVDFYANGGINQPGCGKSNWITCSHNRAYKYYAESIYYKTYNYGFFSKQNCGANDLSLVNSFKDIDDPVLVGEFCDPKISGVFNFITNSSAPYTVNHLKIPEEILNKFKLVNARDIEDGFSQLKE